jgi:protoheme IX farnesyltransferase
VAHSAISDETLPHAGGVANELSSLGAAYMVLFKLRVSVMVIITAAAGLYLGDLRSGVNPFHLQAVFALLGITLVTCGSSALNQALERRSDARMPRTRKRPMVTGRIGLMHGLLLGFAAVGSGTLLLAAETNPLTTTLTLLTATGYVAIYTPLKRITSLNTFIGAFPGALPPLIGWTAARGLIEWPAVALFAVLFVWQFPHFMAIGWMYRDDYRHGGIRLAATQQPISWAARSTVFQALFYAVLMVPVALWTTWLGVTGIPYAMVATLLSLVYLWYTIRFAAILRDPSAAETRVAARNLLKASVIYLPLLMAAMLLNAQGRAPF